jgi:hypothetical protein
MYQKVAFPQREIPKTKKPGAMAGLFFGVAACS